MNDNPYLPTSATSKVAVADLAPMQFRGPSFYIAIGCVVGIVLAFATIPVAHPRQDLALTVVPLCLLGMPVGGLVYRFRSRRWPASILAKGRVIRYSIGSTGLPFFVAMMTGMRGQGFAMTVLAVMISTSFAVGALLAGFRRGNGA